MEVVVTEEDTMVGYVKFEPTREVEGNLEEKELVVGVQEMDKDGRKV